MMLRRYFKKYRYVLLATGMFSAASAGITLAILAKINALASATLVEHKGRSLVEGIMWFIALLCSSGVSQYLSARLGSHLVAQLRTDLSQSLIKAPYETLVYRKNIVFGAFIEDVAQIAPLVLMVPLLAYNGLLAVACAAYLLNLSVNLFGILIVGLSLPLGIAWLLSWMTRHQFDVLRKLEESVFGHLRTITDGKKEMSLNTDRAGHFSEVLLQPSIARTQHQMIRVHLIMGLRQAFSSAMVYMSVFAVVYLGHVLIAAPITQVIPFVIGSLFLIGPLTYLIQVGQQVGSGLASLRHLGSIGVNLESENERPASRATVVPTDWSRICAENLCYEYPSDAEGHRVIGPFSLNIERGELVFITGGNGSGKSTLLLLLCSLLHPTSGRLFIDGRPVDEDLHAYKKLFSGVFGDFFLFQHVLDAAGSCLSDEQIATLLEKVELDKVVKTSSGELSRVTLSTGQRKRLALLQYYAEDRDIGFFDEWAADQDPAFRDRFYKVILPELKSKGKTLLVISHDDRYFHLADRIVKLEGGRIVSDARTISDHLSTGTASMAGLPVHLSVVQP